MSVEGIQSDSSEVASEEVLNSEVQPEQVQETKAEPEKPKIDDKLSSKFAALSRKEKAIRQQELQLKQQMQQWQQQLEAERQEKEKLKQEYEQYRTSMKNSPLQKLQEEGFSFEDLTNMQLNEQNPTPEMLIKRTKAELEQSYKSEIEALKRQIEETEKKKQEEAESRTVEQYKRQINDHISVNADKYEMITMNEASELVFEVAEQYYNQEGRLLSVEEAADYTEKYLEEEARRLMNAKKLQQQLGQPPKNNSEPPKKEASMTLSNNLSTEVPVGNQKKLSRDEEIEAAAKLLRWET
jgi:hypothetical protein